MFGGPVVLLGDIFLLVVKIVVALLQTLFQLMCPSRPKSLQGEVILVTGAGHGLGYHLALQLASLGAIVVGWDVDADRIETNVKEIGLQGNKAFGYVCDVSDRQAVMKTAGAVKRDVGSVTMAVNNAAILQYGSVLNQDAEDLRRHFDVNVLAQFWVLQAVLPGMVEQRRGHLVALCSMSGLCGSPDMAAYSSTKFALRGLMESLREEIRLDPRGLNIHCTIVYPFFIDTGMARNPHFRFPCMFAPLPPDEAAREIIKAVRSNCCELSLPRSLLWADRINRLLPKTVVNHGMDFLRGDGVRQCYLQIPEADAEKNDQM